MHKVVLQVTTDRMRTGTSIIDMAHQCALADISTRVFYEICCYHLYSSSSSVDPLSLPLCTLLAPFLFFHLVKYNLPVDLNMVSLANSSHYHNNIPCFLLACFASLCFVLLACLLVCWFVCLLYLFIQFLFSFLCIFVYAHLLPCAPFHRSLFRLFHSSSFCSFASF